MKLNPIPTYHTFKTQDEMLDHIEQFQGRDRALVMLGMGLTWNLIAYLTAEAENETRGSGKQD